MRRLLLASVAVAASAAAAAAMPLDPLTGATPDPGAALGMPVRQAVFFDGQGRALPDAAGASRYSITDRALGTTTPPKLLAEMSDAERKEFGVPKAAPAGPLGGPEANNGPAAAAPPLAANSRGRAPASPTVSKAAAPAAAPLAGGRTAFGPAGDDAPRILHHLERLYDGASAHP